jgi:hypothetical protein
MFKDSLGMCTQILLAQFFFITNTLGVNVYKTFKCDKDQVLYYNV